MKKFVKTILLASVVLALTLEAKVNIVTSISKPVGTVDKDFDDSEIQFGIAIQPYFNDNIALDIRLDSSNANLMADGGKTDLERASLNLLYDFNFKSGISPYLFAGAGYEKIHRTYKNIKSQSFTNAGVGLKVDINNDIDVRSEVKYIKMNDTKDTDIIASIGFGLKFGNENCEVVCEEDILKDKPEVKTAVSELKVKPVAKPLVSASKSSSVAFSDEKIPTTYKKVKKYKTDTVKKGRNYIQVAAMADKNNVKKIIKKLKVKKLKVKTIKKGSTTVVLVGPYRGNALSRAYSRVKTIQKDAFYKKL